MPYVNLFNETHYSMNGASSKIEDLILKAVEFNYGFLAITDNKLHGVPKFYKSCLKHDIKPLIGFNTNLKISNLDASFKILLYAKNNNGYKNLLMLSSIDNLDGGLELSKIKEYIKDTIAIIITDGSVVEKHILSGNKEYLETIKELKNNFDNLYFSVLNSSVDQELKKHVDMVVIELSKYILEEDLKVSKALSKIFNTSYSDIFTGIDSNHFKSESEVKNKYQEYLTEIENTINIANLCSVTLDFTKILLPKYEIKQAGVIAKDYLSALVFKGLDKRLIGTKKDKKKYIERLTYELRIINEMGYNDYFLIVWDFVKYSKKNKYLVGPGRGSAAGSLVSWCLGITSIDSLEYDLVFERFLNPERITMPDIDMDFPDDKRDDIIKYVRDFYGKDQVASICTFGTFQMKSSLRDSARILETKPLLLDEILKEAANYPSLKEMIASSVNIHKYISLDENAKELIEIASKIEGLVRHVSTHAAGIIVSDGPITNHSPVQSGLLDMIQTQYEAKELEDLGLLKIDFLGLRNLTIIDKTLTLIKTHEKKTINIYNVPLDDKATYDLLKRVDTTGVFQLESQGMRSLIRQMQISNFEDIVTVLALFRPGPMENIPSYIRRRNKEEVVTYQHKVLEDILKSTNGIIIYQEQILKILNLFAGYSLGEADVVRRAVSKKKQDVLIKERSKFIQKSKAMGHSEALANEIYEYIVKFANYGFNRSHSVAYAMVAYWTAYLKANYPKYYISVLTSSVVGSESQTKNYIYEANKLGVKVLPPNINISTSEFVIKGNTLIYPLLGIKNLGVNTVVKLIEERTNNPFISYIDFIARTNVFLSKRVIEALIYSGALDNFKLSKRTMIEKLDEAISFTQYGSFIKTEDFLIEDFKEFEFDYLRENEKNVLGFNLSIHLINKYQDYILKHKLLSPSKLTEKDISQKDFRIIGVVSHIKEITTKNNKTMAFIEIEDEFKKISGVIFTDLYNEVKSTLKKNEVYLFLAKLEKRNNNLQLVIMKAHNLLL